MIISNYFFFSSPNTVPLVKPPFLRDALAADLINETKLVVCCEARILP